MSQYFGSVFILIHLALFSCLISLSFCDKQSLEVIFYNNSALEIIRNFDSNSSLYDEEQTKTRNKTVLINSKFKTTEELHQCVKDKDCKNGKCCQYYIANEKTCVYYSSFDLCGGYFGQKCEQNWTNPCEEAFGLHCLTPEYYSSTYRYVCRCKNNMYFNTERASCENSKNDSGSAMQIYKITMIFASCCLALILIIFLVCILRKSYCAPRRQAVPLDNSTIPDIFTLFPHVGNYDGGPLADGTLPPFEKPPTYDETLTLIRNEIGIPPPAYRSGNTPNSSSQSSPSMSTRVFISNPTLFTVSNESNSRTNSGSNSASDDSLAGPSGSRTSHQGIDNPAFC